jgi:hypothetical protein
MRAADGANHFKQYVHGLSGCGEYSSCAKNLPLGDFKADFILSHICHNRLRARKLASGHTFGLGDGSAIPV